MATVDDLILTPALRELGIIGLTDTAPAELSTLTLGQLNRLLDEWNAEKRAIYADLQTTPAALTAGTNPHTIGPSGATLTSTTSRPVSIEGIRLTTDDGETYLAPLTQRDRAWWHSRSSPGTQSDYPTDFYYEPTWPNGSIYFSPEPGSSSVKAQLWYRYVLVSLAASDTFTMPPGYQTALLESVKEKLTLLPMFASAASPAIAEAARTARALIFGNNDRVPALVTADVGMGGGNGRAYDYQTGPFSLMR